MNDPTEPIELLLGRSSLSASDAELAEFARVDGIQRWLIDLLYAVEPARYADPATQFRADPVNAEWDEG